MKIAACLFFSFLIFQITTAAQTPAADVVLKPIYAKAVKENKKVLLIFHASWCGWCKKMDASLADSSIRNSIDKAYVTSHLTVYESPTKKELENPGALEMLTKFGGADKGLPYWYVLDAKGNKLAGSEHKPGGNTGCPASEEEVAYFIEVLKKTSLITTDELQKIKKCFRKNEL
jgi:thioredoxin-related protein